MLRDQGIIVEPGEPLIVRRTLKSDGGSRGFIGATSVPAGLMRELGGLMVEIHGQHDDRGLLNPKGHRQLLDAFGRIDSGPVAAAWAEVARIERELGQARTDAADAERDVEPERAGGNGLDLDRGARAEPHRAALAEGTVDLRQSGVERLLLHDDLGVAAHARSLSSSSLTRSRASNSGSIRARAALPAGRPNRSRRRNSARCRPASPRASTRPA